MTKKDYIVIARVFNTTMKIWTDARGKWQKKTEGIVADAELGRINEKIDGINKILASMNVIVRGLSHELKKDNPKFDAQKFAAACGLPQVEQERVHEAVVKGLGVDRMIQIDYYMPQDFPAIGSTITKDGKNYKVVDNAIRNITTAELIN